LSAVEFISVHVKVLGLKILLKNSYCGLYELSQPSYQKVDRHSVVLIERLPSCGA
jgi:hypothetical protein